MTIVEILGAASAAVKVIDGAAKLVGGAVKAEVASDIYSALDVAKEKINEQAALLVAEKERAASLACEVTELKLAVAQAKYAEFKANAKLAEEEKRLADFGRYALVRVADELLIQALKKSCAEEEPAHWLCPRCASRGVKSVLQYATRTFEAERPYTAVRCLSCGLSESFLGEVAPRYA